MQQSIQKVCKGITQIYKNKETKAQSLHSIAPSANNKHILCSFFCQYSCAKNIVSFSPRKAVLPTGDCEDILCHQTAPVLIYIHQKKQQ